MIEAKINKAEIDKLREFFQATNRELNAASNRAIRKTITWIKSKTLKEVSTQSGVQQKVLKDRARTSVDTSKKEGKFWFGVWRVSLARLNPKQTKKGVKAGLRGSIYREGAFLAPLKNSTLFKYQVFKRAGKKRLPIIKQVYDFRVSADTIKNKIMPQVPGEVTKKLRQELNWETSKR